MKIILLMERILTSNWFIRLLMVCVVGVMVMSAAFFNVGKYDYVDDGALWLALGALILLLILLVMWNYPPCGRAEARPYASPTPQKAPMYRIRWVFVLLGIMALAILAEMNGYVFRIPQLRHVSSHIQFALWVGGIGSLAYGFAGWRYAWSEKKTTSGAIRRVRVPLRDKTFRQHLMSLPRQEVIGVGVVLTLATVIRGWQLETLIRLWVDEIHFSNPVLHFNINMNIDLLTPFSSVAAFSYVFPYIQWHFVELIGWNLAGLRMLSVIMGVANILALYLLTRELFNRRVAMMAMVAFASLPIHIQFSRLALNNIADPLFGTLTFYFIARGLKYPHQMRGNFAWAGAMLGLTQYFYEGGRFVYPVLVLGWFGFVGGWAYLRHIRPLLTFLVIRKNTRRAILAGLSHLDPMPIIRAGMILWVVAICVGAPVYYTLISRNHEVAPRLETAGISDKTVNKINGVQDVANHVIGRLYESAMIHVAVPEAQLYYGGDSSFLIGIIIPFFLIGTAYALWLMLFGGVFQTQYVAGASLMLIWVGITWFGNVFLEESRISARYVVEFPALATLIGLGAVILADGLFLRDDKWRNRLLAGLVCVIFIPQVVHYFNHHLPLFNQQFRDDRGRNYDVEDTLYRSVGFPPHTRVHIIDFPAMYSPDAYNILRFLTRETGADMQATTLRPDEFTNAYLDAQPRITDHAFYLPPIDLLNIDRLKLYYGEALQGPFYTEFPTSKEKGMVLYYVPSNVATIADNLPAE